MCVCPVCACVCVCPVCVSCVRACVSCVCVQCVQKLVCAQVCGCVHAFTSVCVCVCMRVFAWLQNQASVMQLDRSVLPLLDHHSMGGHTQHRGSMGAHQSSKTVQPRQEGEQQQHLQPDGEAT